MESAPWRMSNMQVGNYCKLTSVEEQRDEIKQKNTHKLTTTFFCVTGLSNPLTLYETMKYKVYKSIKGK